MKPGPINVVVAGVPRSYQSACSDGCWLTRQHVEQITNVSPRISLVHTTENELLNGHLPPDNAHVLLVEASGDEPYHDEISAPNMAKLVTPELAWMQSCSSGVGHILDLGLIDTGTQLTNAAGVHANAIAESVMAAILFHAKQLRQRIHNQQIKKWHELHCKELTRQTILIIGTGKIGCETARLAKAFNLHTIGLRRTARPAPHFDKVLATNELSQVLGQADYIVIACPLTAQTKDMIAAPQFSLMKPNAYLINIARGKIIDEAALLTAVTSHQISGAFLDALSEEPLPQDHPFWLTPDITIIPHDSHSSPLIGDNIISLFCENLQHFVSGKPLINLVDKSSGY